MGRDLIPQDLLHTMGHHHAREPPVFTTLAEGDKVLIRPHPLDTPTQTHTHTHTHTALLKELVRPEKPDIPDRNARLPSRDAPPCQILSLPQPRLHLCFAVAIFITPGFSFLLTICVLILSSHDSHPLMFQTLLTSSPSHFFFSTSLDITLVVQ